MSLEYLVLGKGFCGSRFCESEANSLGTSHIKGDGELYFDLNDRDSWQNLPACPSKVLLTFKVLDLLLIQDFYQEYLHQAQQVIVIGSVAVYQVKFPNETISEATEIDFDKHPRAHCEEFLRSKGATILHSGLIWGYERSFEKWLNSGRIKNASKLINPIHVDDIVNVLQALFKSDSHNENIILSDGKAIEWKCISEHYQVDLPSRKPGLESKVLDNSKLLSIVGKYEFKEPV